VLHQRSRCLDHVDIGLFDNDFLAGTLAAGLFAGLLRPANDHTLAESIESMHQDIAKAAAIGDQKRDRGDTPHDAEHGEQAARHVAFQRGPGFENDF